MTTMQPSTSVTNDAAVISVASNVDISLPLASLGAEVDVTKPSKAAEVDESTCVSTCVSTVLISVPSTVDNVEANDGDGNSSVASSVTNPLMSAAAPPPRVAVRQGAMGGSNACVQWRCGDKFYSELIRDGLRYKAQLGGKSVEEAEEDAANVVMLYESPSTSSKETSFYNSQVFPVHDYPPFDPAYKTVLAPLRYSMMNGDAYPSYLLGEPPAFLLEHWRTVLPEVPLPSFVSEIAPQDRVYAYLPLEHINKHVNDPHVHYHLAGKDALHLMTPNTPKRLPNTKDVRPCIAKVTHSMASKGIFVINSDEDEEEMNEFLNSSGNPNFVVTDFVDIARNVSCHFFIHPSGEIVWFGSSENYKLPSGGWGLDSMIDMTAQDELRDLQLPYAREVADYCLSLGFWGFCGIDVLFDPQGKGYIVDVNPRTTGTCPALMAGRILESRHGYSKGVFRRSSSYAYPGSRDELMKSVEAFNEENAGDCTIVLVSVYESNPTKTLLNIGVYGHDLAHCRDVLSRYAHPLSSSGL